jgi:3-isopropylmalate/(R)-2-methylmalate dehydratase small subunit
MAYDSFTIVTDTAIPLPIENIDTDQIIPARFLKATERIGFGENLFRDWRFDNNNQLIESFALNNPNFSGKILVAEKNFGCGSSREHAVWALYDYGIRVVVSSFFADIFKNNCYNIGVLPVKVSEEFLDKIFKILNQNSKSKLEINLPLQKITIIETNESEFFDINSYKKENMLHGFDDIDFLLNSKDEIIEFSKK